jgi:hypothetical protein
LSGPIRTKKPYGWPSTTSSQLLIKHPVLWYVYAVRGVAQHGSALALGARSRWFKSSRPDHFFLTF